MSYNITQREEEKGKMLRDIVDTFLTKVKIENNNKNTDQAYSSALKQVMKFCEQENILSLNDVTEEFYLKFLNYGRCKEWCNRTINKRLVLFIAVLKQNNVYFDWFNKKKLKEKQKRFETITTEDKKKIMNYIVKLENDPINLTDKLIIMLLFDTGVRIDELLNIKREYVDLKSKFIYLIKTKTNVDRYVFFNKYTNELLKQYFKIKVDTEYLLYNFRKNQAANYRQVQCLLEKLKKELKIVKLHPHMFRHTLATDLIIAEAPTATVQKLLGHSSIRTTEGYIHFIMQTLQAQYQKFTLNRK